MPQRDDTPTRWSEASTGRSAAEQSAIDRELLKSCTASGSLERLRSALERGADPNCAVPQHWGLAIDYPLQALAVSDRSDSIAALLAAGADPGRTDRRGLNALAIAVVRGVAPQPLLDGGVVVDTLDSQGRTALHQISRIDEWRAIAALLRLGAAIDATDADGMTPLHIALAHGSLHTAFALLNAGADPHRVTGDGLTSYHMAAIGLAGDALSSMIDLLKARGVANRADHSGWLPHMMVPVDRDIGLPKASPAAPHTPREESLCEPPRALVLAVLTGVRGGWEVLGDWLQERSDIRGDLIAMGLAEEAHRLPRGSLARELTRLRAPLLAPFWRAHPLGALVDTQGEPLFHRGILSQLNFGRRFLPGLPRLLDHSAARLLHTLQLDLPDELTEDHQLSALLPAQLLVRNLFLMARGGGELVLPDREALPALRTLRLRGPVGMSMQISHEDLEVLHIEQPLHPDRTWICPIHTLQAPSLRSLQISAGRPFDPKDSGWKWLYELLQQPPASLKEISISPTCTTLFEILLSSPGLQTLRSLSLYGPPELLSVIERRIEDLARAPKLEHVSITLEGIGRAVRFAAQKRLYPQMPKLVLRGGTPRTTGSYM